MIYGYVRISTKKQNILRQVRNIIASYPDAKIYEETFTGTDILGRKEFNSLLNKVAMGDTIVFDSVSRMSRDAEDGFKIYKELLNKGIELVFLKEPHINTSTFKMALGNKIETTGNEIADKYIKTTNEVIELIAEQQIKIAFEQSEKEVMDLRQRTKEGIETARNNGKKIGVQPGTKRETKRGNEIKEIIRAYSKDFNGTSSDKKIMELNKIGRNSYYRHKKELMELKAEGGIIDCLE